MEDFIYFTLFSQLVTIVVLVLHIVDLQRQRDDLRHYVAMQRIKIERLITGESNDRINIR